ncbi:S8 family serine peptidase [Priestia megaterium]|uniref:S8 family serine peptidase n=1 Tax=Priestia megaterium TaxID=1404 RepID=A0A6H1NWG4_PRIMG|nr:S8 family serine peptidase [Priestia megaterium]QIZ05623.1 S8 family serine peptidase [Priestia megaterium]
MRKRSTALLVSMGLIFSSIPAFAAGNQSDGGTQNFKKASQNVNSVIQIQARSPQSKKKATYKNDAGKQHKKGEVIVKFKNAYTTESLGALTTKLGLKTKQHLNNNNTKLLTFNANIPIENVLKTLIDSALIEYAEPNYLIKPDAVTDPYYSELWGMKNTGQTILGVKGKAGIDIGAEGAWAVTKGSSSLVIGVIDTGVDINHPDLKAQIWKNPGEIAGDKIDNDKNGYIDDVNGWDFYNKDNTVFDVADGDEHGTHVSGTIAGTANTTGVIGLAPNVKIMPLKFLGPDGGYTSDAILAVNYAKAKGVKITNNSWGGGGFSQALYDAIKGSNSLFLAAAGNDGTNNDSSPHYPSNYDLPNILSVAALDNTGNLAYFSNYGAKTVDIAAPGQDILSTIPPYFGDGDYTYGYDYFSGTSMATPHVTGEAALILSKNPTFTPAVIKDTIMKQSTALSSLTGKILTGSMARADKALVVQSDNDIPGVAFPGTSVSNTVSATTDLDDVYSINLVKGQKITVTLSGATGTDFDIYLYNSAATTVKSSANIVAYSEKAATSSETFTYTAPNDGKYYLDVYAYKGAGSYTATLKTDPIAGAGTYENTAKQIGYTPSWSTVSNTSVSGGSYATTNTAGTKAQFTFNGASVSITGLKAASQGYVKITLDGVSTQVSLYSASTLYKQTYYTKTGLTSGKHVLTIEWTGKSATGVKKSATAVNLDTIIVK